MTRKGIRVSGMKSKNLSYGPTFEETVASRKLHHPGKTAEIEKRAAELIDEMKLGGVAVQETQIALLNEFPDRPSSASKRPRRIASGKR